jgi:hypothetical protein
LEPEKSILVFPTLVLLNQEGKVITTKGGATAARSVCFGLVPLIPFFSCPSFLFVFRRTSNHSSEHLWEMMLGSMLWSGEIESAAWTNDLSLLVYQLTYTIAPQPVELHHRHYRSLDM